MGADADGDGVAGAARELRRARDGELPVLGTSMTAGREDAFDAVAQAFATEADGLEALLRPDSVSGGATSLPLLGATAVTPPAPGPELTGTAAEAEQLYGQRPRDDKAKHRPLNQVVSRFPPKMQGLAKKLLFNRSSHAVQRHGHHLRPEHQIARLQWRLDPAFADGWQRHDDGSVTSSRGSGRPHQVEETAGHYTSPDAVVKPLAAILTAAGRPQHALDTYLNDAAGEEETLVRLFLHPDVTGITSDDVYTVRGVGADTTSGQRLWRVAREGALNGHGSAPSVREYDQVNRGTRPGSLVIFAKGNSTNWRLITSYFADDPDDTPYTEL